MSTTGWTAKTGYGRYLRHRYPHYDRLRIRPSTTAGDLVARIDEATNVVGAGRFRQTAGGAFHQRIGFLHQDIDLTTCGATFGRRRATCDLRRDRVWEEVCRRALELAQLVRGREWVDPESADELELARLCALLALYEQVDVSRATLPIMYEPPAAPLSRLLSYVDEQDVRDVVQMTALYVEHFPHELATTPVLVEPNLHPGVADLLLGGLLLELKATTKASINDEFAYTLLGYVLQTTPDFPSPGVPLTHVGWYFGRQGLPWIFDVDDFLSTMAGVPVTLEAARAEHALVAEQPLQRIPQWALELMEQPVTRARLNRSGRAGPSSRLEGRSEWQASDQSPKGALLPERVHRAAAGAAKSDDIDGSGAAETLSFALDGLSFEIDLTAEHAAELRAALAPYTAAGRRIGRSGRPSPVRTVDTSGYDPQTVRA